jgi:hypothetical protein
MGSIYLAASPSVWSGAARLFDLGNTFDSYNHALTGIEADALGLFWDWVMIGEDMWQALYQVGARATPESSREGCVEAQR